MQANKIFSAGASQYSFLERNLPDVIRSDGTVEKFDPTRIKNSILKETSISMDDAQLITEEITRKLLSSENKVITAPFIREEVCIKLFDMNPKWRFEYTRLGIPYHDFKKNWGDFFDQIISEDDLDNGMVDNLASTMDKKKITELIRRMAKDYVGVRDNIKNYDD